MTVVAVNVSSLLNGPIHEPKASPVNLYVTVTVSGVPKLPPWPDGTETVGVDVLPKLIRWLWQ